MPKRSWIIVAGLLICACLINQIISPLWGQQKAKSDQPAAGSDREQETALDIRYAEAYLAFMEATLARYEESNRAMPNTIRPAVTQGIQEAVRKARERVQLAQSDQAGDVQYPRLERRVQPAPGRRSLATCASREHQNRGPSATVRSVGCKPKWPWPKVRVEKARHLGSESPLSNVNFELELLREDVQDLKLLMTLQLMRN